MYDSDTIASMATPPGRGGIGIIRISGPEALAVVRRHFTGTIPEDATHRLYYGHIKDPSSGELVDEVMVGVMLAPRSYTREDVVEINCHGGPVAVARVLGLVIKGGARPAEAGEFTRRAFMNGRIDLSQAEAVLDIIEARSVEAERLAMSQLKGALSDKVGSLREALVNVCSELEAHIDFPEEDIEPATVERMGGAMDEVARSIEAMVATFEGGRLFREGLRTAIVGRPNVGKSSLLNVLLQEDRAIVTEIPGTTRDIIEECVSIKGLPLRIMDTAGIRESHDMVEREGVRRSLMALEDADLVMAVFDASQPLHDEDRMVLDKLRGKRHIVVRNKCDLPIYNDGGVASIHGNSEAGAKGPGGIVNVSAMMGEGVEELKVAIYEAALGGSSGLFEGGEGVVITNERHKSALHGGHGAVMAARKALGSAPLEVIAMELRDALEHLGSIIGEVSPDDLLNNIFTRFCIGK